jgi:hypothetical protein
MRTTMRSVLASLPSLSVATGLTVCARKPSNAPRILRRSQGDVDRRTDAEDTVDIGMPDEFRLWDRSMSDTLLSDGIVHSRNVLRPTS